MSVRLPMLMPTLMTVLFWRMIYWNCWVAKTLKISIRQDVNPSRPFRHLKWEYNSQILVGHLEWRNAVKWCSSKPPTIKKPHKRNGQLCSQHPICWWHCTIYKHSVDWKRIPYIWTLRGTEIFPWWYLSGQHKAYVSILKHYEILGTLVCIFQHIAFPSLHIA